MFDDRVIFEKHPHVLCPKRPVSSHISSEFQKKTVENTMAMNWGVNPYVQLPTQISY